MRMEGAGGAGLDLTNTNKRERERKREREHNRLCLKHSRARLDVPNMPGLKLYAPNHHHHRHHYRHPQIRAVLTIGHSRLHSGEKKPDPIGIFKSMVGRIAAGQCK